MFRIPLQYFGENEADKEIVEEKKLEEKKADENKTFTQEEINRMMTTEKNQGRLAALKELGLEGDIKDVKKLIESFKAEQEAKKTDLQKKEEAIKELSEKEKVAAQKAIMLEAKLQAMQSGVNADYVDDIIVIAMPKVTEAKDLKAVLEEMKTKYSAFFTKTEIRKEGTGGSVGGIKKTSTEENLSLGERLAAKNSANNKSVYFKN